ncbi:MAG TPA: malonyl-CoA synthase [Steroidobacteraceae bacterium]|jgi:malonyl-CoA/methylmalonyl-CoA synthetase|nr:malonyl-CoA synthase [Steroidobacteraceae bacterium]
MRPERSPTDALFAALCRRGAALQREFLRTDTGRTLRYADLHAESARLAHALVALGVRPGERVAVQVDKSPEAVLLYLATLRAGAVYLPLNTAYTEAELEYFIADAQPALFVCTRARLPQLQPLAARLHVRALVTLGTDDEGDTDTDAGAGTVAGAVPLLTAARALPAEFDDVPRHRDDLAAILYTSGTTGRSKGAMLTHGNLLSNARTLALHWRFSADDVLLHALPIFHIHGLFVAINVTLAAGSSLLFLPRFDPAAVLAALPHTTVMMGVPTFYVRLLNDARLDRARVARSRLFISGSAPLLTDTHSAWRERTGHVILERYGLSETGMNCSNPYDGERVPGSVGPPLPDVSLRISDPASAAPLPAGAIGMIEVRGPNVFAGYWGAPDKTRAQMRPDGYFITGDLGRVDERGYVYIVGRGTDLVISGGYNVYPKEVETEIDALPGVLESAVIGLPHPDFGEGVTAVVVPHMTATLTESAILAQLRARLAAYKLPKRIIFVDELPRNVMGKVQKAQLRARYAGLYEPHLPERDT